MREIDELLGALGRMPADPGWRGWMTPCWRWAWGSSPAQDVAALLHLSEKAVETRLYRARMKLTEMMRG